MSHDLFAKPWRNNENNFIIDNNSGQTYTPQVDASASSFPWPAMEEAGRSLSLDYPEPRPVFKLSFDRPFCFTMSSPEAGTAHPIAPLSIQAQIVIGDEPQCLTYQADCWIAEDCWNAFTAALDDLGGEWNLADLELRLPAGLNQFKMRLSGLLFRS